MSTIMDTKNADQILGAVNRDRVLAMEQAAVRIPSYTFEESACAEYFAGVMREAGLEVEMVEVKDPFAGRKTQQPVGRLRGTGGGASLMLNGHMDHREMTGKWDREPFSGDFQDGWIYGRGCQDDKGGIVAMIAAVEAIVKAGVKLRGDVLVCPVAGHKSGGLGTQTLFARGYLTDLCINTENSGNGIARVNCGALRYRIHARSRLIHPHSTEAQRARYLNPVEQLALIIAGMGPSLEPIPEGDWLTFKRDPDMPTFPQIHYDEIIGDHMTRVTSDEMTMTVQLRTVLGQTIETVKADVERLLATLAKKHPNLNATVEIPLQSGRWAGMNILPFTTSADSELVTTIARNHQKITGTSPVNGSKPRLGAVGCGNLVAAQGVQTVLYGPGSSSIFESWPTSNERISLEELMVCTKTLALSIAELCG